MFKVRSLISWLLLSCVSMNILGWLVGFYLGHSSYSTRRYYIHGFFDLLLFERIPYWLFATILSLVANGLVFYRLKPGVEWGQGRASVDLPHFKLIGLNILMFCLMIGGYIVLMSLY